MFSGEYCEIFKEQLFYRKLLVATSGRNCSESYNEFLDSYFFNLRKCLFRIFPDSHFWNHTSEKSNRPVFVNMNLVFLLALCANSLVDSFPFKYMPCWWSLIWLNRVWLRVSYFFKLTLGSDCLEFCFCRVAFKTILTQQH